MRRCLRACALWSCALGLLFVSVPVASGATRSAVGAPLPGSLSGFVNDAVNGDALGGFDLYTWRFDSGRGVWVQDGWNERTDVGVWSWKGLSGSFRLQVRTWTMHGFVNRYYPDADTVEQAMTLNIAPGDVVTGIDTAVVIPNRILGTVMRTESKTPMNEAMVYPTWYESATGLWNWNIDYFFRTGANGSYCGPDQWGLNPADYRLKVMVRDKSYKDTYYGQTYSSDAAATIHLADLAIVRGADVWLSNTAAVAGTVLDGSGLPRPDVRVTAFRSTASGWVDAGSDYSDADGRYRVLVGSAGVYTVRFTDLAGTYDTSDDFSRFLGGADVLEDAATITVSPKLASVPAPFELAAAQAIAVDRIAAPTDLSSAIAASKSVFPTASASSLPSASKSFGVASEFGAADPVVEATPTVVVTGAGHFAEAACASGLAGVVDGPVLLTGPTELFRGMLPELARLGTRQIYVVGSSKIVPENQLVLLRALGYIVERVDGADRNGLAANVARKIAQLSVVTSATPVFVVRGDDAPDALIVAPAAYAAHGIVLFVDKKTTPKPTASVIKGLGLKTVYAVGDKKTLPSSAIAGLSKAGAKVTRGSYSSDPAARASNFASVALQRGWLSASRAGLACLTSLGQSLGSPAALGHVRAPLLFVTKTSLTKPTAGLLKARAKRTEIVHMFSRASSVGTKVLLSAGSH